MFSDHTLMNGDAPYRLSWWSEELTTVVQRRPWWNLWGRDVVLTHRRPVMHSMLIGELEFQALMAARQHHYFMPLLERMLSVQGKVWDLTCEANPCWGAAPIATSGSIACRPLMVPVVLRE